MDAAKAVGHADAVILLMVGPDSAAMDDDHDAASLAHACKVIDHVMPATRLLDVLNDLRAMHLVVVDAETVRDPVIRVTGLGTRFLESVHPDMRDVDLPLRWTDPRGDHREAMDSWLTRNFRKCKAGMARDADELIP